MTSWITTASNLTASEPRSTRLFLRRRQLSSSSPKSTRRCSSNWVYPLNSSIFQFLSISVIFQLLNNSHSSSSQHLSLVSLLLFLSSNRLFLLLSPWLYLLRLSSNRLLLFLSSNRLFSTSWIRWTNSSFYSEVSAPSISLCGSPFLWILFVSSLVFFDVEWKTCEWASFKLPFKKKKIKKKEVKDCCGSKIQETKERPWLLLKKKEERDFFWTKNSRHFFGIY